VAALDFDSPTTAGICPNLSATKSTNSPWFSIPAPQTKILFGVMFSSWNFYKV
jgi:hypothetical protein